MPSWARPCERKVDLAKDFAGGIASETSARASTAPYPFRDHRTLAEAD